ncbi:MAG: N-acetyl-gamma-glutamyl-phosphate reductase [Bacteroidota bacterium]
MIKVGIAGGAGYTAGELLRILINHSEVEITSVLSTSSAGKNVYEIHQDLVGETELTFTDKLNDDIDVLFLCLGHGNSKKFLQEQELTEKVKIIDLSNDFRLNMDMEFNGRTFVYGLPETKKEEIKQADNIANPGCFATAIQEALLPAAANGWLTNDVHINAITGSTGAGQSLSETTHFSWRNNNVSIYKPFTHQHLGEIGETIAELDDTNKGELNFIPVRGNFTRGIFASIYTKSDKSLDEWISAYKEYFNDAPFVTISDKSIHLKQVVNTNNCLIHLEKHGDKILITSVIDNLVKGASGQAIHNMNLMFGFEETTGLKLKASNF